MKKLFVLAESTKRGQVENLWYFFAADVEDLARQIVGNDEKYQDILSRLAGYLWDHAGGRSERPSARQLLDTIAASFGEEYRYQIFELPAEAPGQFHAGEIRLRKRKVFPSQLSISS